MSKWFLWLTEGCVPWACDTQGTDLWLCAWGCHARVCHNTPEQEPGSTCKHLSHLHPHMCRTQSRPQLSLPWFLYLFQHSLPISFTPISSSQSQFPFFQLFTMVKEEQDEVKSCVILLAPSSNAKRTYCFSLGSSTVVNQILIKIIELLPKRGWKNLLVSTQPVRGSGNGCKVFRLCPSFPAYLGFPILGWHISNTHALCCVAPQKFHCHVREHK